MGGPAEAMAHYKTALALADAAGDPASGHLLTLRAAAAANGSGRLGRAMALLKARLDTDLPTDHERAELIAALALEARMTEGASTGCPHQQALGLLGDDAPVRLRVGLLARRAEALMDSGAVRRGAGRRRRRHGAGRRARPHRRPHRPRLDPGPAQRDRRRPRRVDPPARGRSGRLDPRARPGAAARDAHPGVGALPAGRPPGRPGGLRAHRRRGAPGRPGVVGLRRRRPGDGRDHRLRDGRLGPRAAARRPRADLGMPSWAPRASTPPPARCSPPAAWSPPTSWSPAAAPGGPTRAAPPCRGCGRARRARPRRRGRRGCSPCTPSRRRPARALGRGMGRGRGAAGRDGARAPRHRAALRVHARPPRRAARPCRPARGARRLAVFGDGSLLHAPSLEGRGLVLARVDAEHERVRWAAGDDVPVDALVTGGASSSTLRPAR